MCGCVESVGGNAAGASVSVSQVQDETIYDVDYRTLASQDFVAGGDGNYTIAGAIWAVANTATANTFGLVLGTGLRFNAAPVNTVYTNASRTAANLAIIISTLMPAFDPTRTYVVDVFLSSVTFGTSGNRFFTGFLLDAAGTDRLLGGGRRNTAGTAQTYSQNDATVNGDAATDDALGVRCDNRGVFTGSGTYNGGADLFPDPYPRLGGSFSLTDSFNGPLDPTQGRIVLAFPTGEAGGAMDCTVARLRVRRIAA